MEDYKEIKKEILTLKTTKKNIDEQYKTLLEKMAKAKDTYKNSITEEQSDSISRSEHQREMYFNNVKKNEQFKKHYTALQERYISTVKLNNEFEMEYIKELKVKCQLLMIILVLIVSLLFLIYQ